MTLQANKFWWLLIPLLLLAAWLGSRSLNDDVIWGDEYHTVYDAGVSFYGPLSPFGVWERVGTRNPWHAPGYFITLNAWQRLTGTEPAILRSMSLLFGMLTIAFTYRLGRDLVSRRVGLYAATIVASSAFFAHYLHEMRVYTLFTFLSVFEMWVYLRVVHSRREPSLIWWLALLGGAVALLYIHYFEILPLAVIGLYHLLFASQFLSIDRIFSPSLTEWRGGRGVRLNRRWWKVVGVMLLAGVLFLPWMRYLLAGLGLAAERESLHERALSAGDALASFAHLFSNGNWLLLVALGVLGIFAAWRGGRGARTVVFLAFSLLAALLLANQILRVMHGGRLRYLIALWPLFALVMALGIDSLRRWKPLPLVALGVWMAFGLYATLAIDFTAGLDGSKYTYPIHQIADELEERKQPGDVVVNYLPDAGLVTHRYEKIASFYYTPMELEYLFAQTIANPREWIAAERDYLLLLGARDRVWLAYMPDRLSTTRQDFEAELARQFTRCSQEYTEPLVTIALYARTEVQCE